MITVFGSINIDQVYQVDRLPVPGETLISHGYVQAPGGKGANQALAAKRSGAKVCLVGCVGDDANADLALSLLKSDGVDLTHLQRANLPTGCASIWVSSEGENSIVVHTGANSVVSADDLPKNIIKEGDYVLLQMEVPAEENWKMLKVAKEAGAHTVLNLAPAGPIPEEALERVDILIVNEVEASFLAHSLDIEITSDEELLRHLSKKYALCCILTLGARGAMVCADDVFYTALATPVTVVDTTAAGDTFIGGFCAALESGKTLEDAMTFAVKVSGLACTKVGAQPSVPYSRESVT
ncbi:MAG: ribokinase [Proteobacteria bacterium]|nr:ribokinase [Pseudomonadota bacterium]